MQRYLFCVSINGQYIGIFYGDSREELERRYKQAYPGATVLVVFVARSTGD